MSSLGIEVVPVGAVAVNRWVGSEEGARSTAGIHDTERVATGMPSHDVAVRTNARERPAWRRAQEVLRLRDVLERILDVREVSPVIGEMPVSVLRARARLRRRPEGRLDKVACM